MNNIFRPTYRELTAEEKQQLDNLKAHASLLYEQLQAYGDSRELSLAKTKLEECVMWAVKAITA